MDDLKLPTPKQALPRSRGLSMDEYLAFVQMLRVYPSERSPTAVPPQAQRREYVPFRL